MKTKKKKVKLLVTTKHDLKLKIWREVKLGHFVIGSVINFLKNFIFLFCRLYLNTNVEKCFVFRS